MRWLRQRAVRGVGSPAGKHFVAPGTSTDDVDDAGGDHAEYERCQCEQEAIIGAPLRDRRIARLGDRQLTGDGAADRDPLAGLQWADDRSVDIADSGQGAAAGRSLSANVAGRTVELETDDVHLEPTGLERLVRSDDVEVQSAGRQLGVGQRVAQHVPVLPAEGRVRIAETDLILVTERRDVDGRVGVG